VIGGKFTVNCLERVDCGPRDFQLRRTKTGLCCLRKRPQSETFYAFQGLSMKITALFFFEANTENLVVQLAARSCLTNDRTKACDE
jgi:hypothetical protein